MTTAKDVREVRKREDVREFRKRRGWLGATCLFLFFCGIALMVWNIDPTSLSPDEVFAAKAKMLTGQKFTNEDRIISFGVTEYDIRPTDWILRPYEAFLEGAADIAWKDGGAVSFRYVATFVYQKDVPHISGERRGTWLFQSSEEEKTSTTVHEHPALEGLADIAAAIALRKTLSGYFAE